MLTVIYATFKRSQIGIRRAQPWSLVIGRIVLGISAIALSYFIFHFFFEGRTTAEFATMSGNADYMTFVVLGAALNVLSFATFMNVGRALITELRGGTLETFIISPASRFGYFLGVFFEQLSRALLEFITILLFGALIGAKVSAIFSLSAILTILLAAASFFCLGVFMSSIMLYTRDTYITQTTLVYSMTLLCGVVFPIDYLPRWAQMIGQIFPLTPTIRLLRLTVLNNASLLDHGGLILQVVGLSAVYLIAGLLWYKKIEKTLIEKIFG